MRCRCKGHNGFGMDWGAHFRVSASCRYWQVLKTFKEVKTLFSVYKSWALPQMLVKSDVRRLTHLPHTGLGSFFSSTNKRSQNILSQIWNIFWWKALTAFCFVRSLLPAQPLLWCSGNQWPGTWLVFRPEEGFWDTWGAPSVEGSLIHVAVDKSFISCKNANLPKQPPQWHYSSILPSGTVPAKQPG